MNKTAPDKLNELLARTVLRDRSAFQQLYQLYAGKLNGIAYRILRNKELANETTQEAFIQIWNHCSEFDPALAQASTWMSAIVRYRAYDLIKREGNRLEGRLHNVSDEDVADLIVDNKNFTEQLASHSAIKSCLSALEPEQRQAIVLAYYYGMSRDELASHFQRTLNTMKSILRRAVMRLQLCLSE